MRLGYGSCRSSCVFSTFWCCRCTFRRHWTCRPRSSTRGSAVLTPARRSPRRGALRDVRVAVVALTFELVALLRSELLILIDPTMKCCLPFFAHFGANCTQLSANTAKCAAQLFPRKVRR